MSKTSKYMPLGLRIFIGTLSTDLFSFQGACAEYPGFTGKNT
jgi:hypothetical protein